MKKSFTLKKGGMLSQIVAAAQSGWIMFAGTNERDTVAGS